ncbi:hypothetical protein BFP97_07775 [Roseivirga sp. 4D4]|uniref:hypothetical protein n=1 Tax=Roseivirga sp. 4D4 TaxID=1889784 RepID=UPI0008538A32|nr:hypothetical protein [Roseivirga sp. 4D4]OEK01424.1 hypothetical protein BFP97_07775 [Roseivirga sp. 4D4]
MDSNYPEIVALNDIYIAHQVYIKIDRSQVLGDQQYYPRVDFKFSGKKFHLFVDDEYDDFRNNYPLLNLCLVLRELEGYEYADDYYVWCQERSLDAGSPQVKDNYAHLGEVYSAIKSIMGKIDSQVSDFDFEMNARAAQALRRSK